MQKARQHVEQRDKMEQSEQSYCERQKLGRLSFQGMNPEIEILMNQRDHHHDTSDQILVA